MNSTFYGDHKLLCLCERKKKNHFFSGGFEEQVIYKRHLPVGPVCLTKKNGLFKLLLKQFECILSAGICGSERQLNLGPSLFPLSPSSPPQGCSSPIVVKFADTQKDKEQRRLQQQLAQQMQQLNSATTWGSLTGLGGLTPQYLAVRTAITFSSSSPFSHLHLRRVINHKDGRLYVTCNVWEVRENGCH